MGFITANIKSVADCKVGDTLTGARRKAATPLPGFKPTVPVVFCGLFPVDSADYENLRDSLGKLALNDSPLHYEPESSAALGFGYRCGCLRSEEHTSELQSLMRISYAVFCLKKKRH